MPNRITIKPGDKYGRLTLIKEVEKRNNTRWFLCKCDCGTIREFRLASMRRKYNPSTSCGCYKNEIFIARNISHNLSRSLIYNVWQAMIQRCCNANNKRFKDYGGRGISVCQEWIAFPSFCKWAFEGGYKKGLTIDRINNDGNYELSNCKWSTDAEQSRNNRHTKLITFNGITLCKNDWASKIGINSMTLSKRLKRWPLEKALTEPPSAKNQHYAPRSIRVQ